MQAEANILAQVDAYIEDHLERALAELGQLSAIPSVAAQRFGIDPCANLVADMLRQRGFAAEIMPTTGNPVVCGEAAGATERTLICYNHGESADRVWQIVPIDRSERLRESGNRNRLMTQIGSGCSGRAANTLSQSMSTQS